MFFSLSSAMVIGHLRGNFQRGVKIREDLPTAGQAAGEFTQPAVVPRQNVPVRTELTAAPSLQSCPGLHSWSPGFWYWACETYGSPWKQADKAYTDSATCVKPQKRDQSA
jgi:hypothetical protein